MSNITQVELQKSIISLYEQGWSERKIAHNLGVHRATVKRYVSDSKCTNPQPGKQGPVSTCEPHRERIKEWFESGLSMERIHHDLCLMSRSGILLTILTIELFKIVWEIDRLNRLSHWKALTLRNDEVALRGLQGIKTFGVAAADLG